MKITRITLLLYNMLLVIVLVTIGFMTATYEELTPTLLLLPIGVYFSILFFSSLNNFAVFRHNKKIRNSIKILKVYSFIVIVLMILASLAYSTNFLEAFMTVLYVPMLVWFCLDLLNKKTIFQFKLKKMITILKVLRSMKPNKALDRSKNKSNKKGHTILERIPDYPPKIDLDKIREETKLVDVQDIKKRQFLKVLGGGGVSLFLMLFVFKQNASAAFFGSGGGPGIVSLKDSNGTQIDPAEKQPTDGYNISEIDDSGTPSYYGFVHKNGNWYIAKEDATGGYRYTKGTSSFSTNWTNRAGLTYDYFDVVF